MYKENKIVIVNGFPGVGKTSFIIACRQEAEKRGWYTGNFSSVDPAKQAAVKLGWDGNKDATGRNFIAALKALSVEHYDGPREYLCNIIRLAPPKSVIFLDIREPVEIEKMRECYPNANTVLIRRPGDFEALPGNAADSGVLDYAYDTTIMNDSTEEELGALARDYTRGLLK